MTREIIQVLQHDIEIEYEGSIPLTCREQFRKDLIDDISESIQETVPCGTVELYYTEEISGEDIENDVDVKWSIVNYKEIADKLYRELRRWPNPAHDQYAHEILQEYE